MGGYSWKNTGKNKRKAAHRLVMESMLGRELRSDEIVHHINHNRADNRPENLELVTRAQHLLLHFPELLAGRAK